VRGGLILPNDPGVALVNSAGQPLIRANKITEQPANVFPKRLTAYDSEDQFKSLHLDPDSRARAIDLQSCIDKSCKQCYGRGYTGRLYPVGLNTELLTATDRAKYPYIFCKCLIRNFKRRVKEINSTIRQQHRFITVVKPQEDVSL
jgi:hypothetical protein